MRNTCLAVIVCISAVVAVGFGSPPAAVQHKEPNLRDTLTKLGYVVRDTTAGEESSASKMVDISSPPRDVTLLTAKVTLAASDHRRPEDPAVMCHIDFRIGKEKIATKDQVVKFSMHLLAFDEEMNDVRRVIAGGGKITIQAGQPAECSTESGFQLMETHTPGWLVWVVLIEDPDATKPSKLLSYQVSRMTLLK